MILSPTGKQVVKSAGPLSAKLVFIGESPAKEEIAEGLPFVGKSGKLLTAALRSAGIARDEVYLMNLVPVRAPGDKFAHHDERDIAFGRDLFYRELRTLGNAKVFVALGANPAEWLLGAKPPVAQRNQRGKSGFIGEWRGSVIPANISDGMPEVPEDYLMHLPVGEPPSLPDDSVIVPTFHPAFILRQFAWHPWLKLDIAKAAKIAKSGVPPITYRQWFFNDVAALERLATSGVDLIAVDTEMDPALVAIVTDDEAHVFEWSESFRQPLTALLTSPRILKIAHNWTHDYAWIRVKFGIKTARPIFDTQGAAHDLNTALQKELSPHIATQFTNWPYHKWLVNIDPYIYCGMDAVVCYDAYWPQLTELNNRGLYHIADHDHKLLTPLMEMQATGFKIDEQERFAVEQELEKQLKAQNAELQQMVEPVIAAKIAKFEKPHLFRVERKCDCCGGGSTQREHCLFCWWQGEGCPDKITKEIAIDAGYKTIKAFKAALPQCVYCKGTGKTTKSLEFNSDSPDQLADVIYRGLGVKARKYKGVETTKAAQLDPIKDKHPIIAKIVEVSKIRADYDTVSRLRAGTDGLLHCVFDPFGTASGRVASKEGLVEPGTNGQNLPKAARRFIVARDGYVFLHPDMAQIEARAVAVLSKDKNLIDAFTQPVDWPGNPRHGQIDSHTKVMQQFAARGVVITRDQAKRFTYAGIYGGQAPQLTVELNAEAYRKGSDTRLTVDEVQRGLDTFFQVFSGVKRWQSDVLDEVLQTRRLRCPFTGRERTWLGYIIDMRKTLGRGRVNPNYGKLKHEIAKQVWSYLPQHMAAYILALGLIDMYYHSEEWGKLLTPVQHGHDALLIETPIDRVEEGKQLATQYLTRDLWGMSFPCGMKTGHNWHEASID